MAKVARVTTKHALVPQAPRFGTLGTGIWNSCSCAHACAYARGFRKGVPSVPSAQRACHLGWAPPRGIDGVCARGSRAAVRCVRLRGVHAFFSIMKARLFPVMNRETSGSGDASPPAHAVGKTPVFTRSEREGVRLIFPAQNRGCGHHREGGAAAPGRRGLGFLRFMKRTWLGRPSPQEHLNKG